MKKLLIIVSVFICLFVFSVPVLADSPITSTHFSDAYMDIDIVKEASTQSVVNSKIAAYLSNAKNPIDVKAAVINALSWDIDGKVNAEEYSKLIYKKSVSKLNLNTLSGDQLFCIGYLKALDNYNEPEFALKCLKLAEKKLNTSYTVSAVRAIVEAQHDYDSIWKYMQKVQENSKLKRDMRQDAVNIILNYMACEGLQVNQNNMLIENDTSKKIYLYGATSIQGEAPYQIVNQSDIAYTSLVIDDYYIGSANITGVKNGSSFIEIKNNVDQSKKINFTVVSSDTYKSLSDTVSMYIGSTNVLKGKEKATINANLVPYLKGNIQYVPLTFVNSAIGAKMQTDAKKGTIITYAGKTFILKNGSNVVSINGKASKLKSKIETKNKQLFISASDYANLMGKKYIYYNGLILFANSKNSINAIDNDYMLEEIISIVSGGKSIFNYPESFEQDGKYGYKDKSGKIVIKPIFEYAYEFSEGLAAVEIKDELGNNKCGYINTKGDFVISPKYEMTMPFASGLGPVILEDGGFIDRNGNEKIAFNYNGVGMFNGGLAAVLDKESNKWGYINTKGELKIPFKFDECRAFAEGVAPVKIDGAWGYIDRTGKLIIPATLEDAGDFDHGIVGVNNDGEYYINRSGKLVVFFDEGDIYVGEHTNGIINGKGVYTWKDGSQYSGDFVDEHYTGIATYTSPEGANQTGSWNDGEYGGDINE